MHGDLDIGRGIVIPASDLSWAATRSSGPGGQNVNKVSTRVELRFDLAHTEALLPGVKGRLRALARNRMDAEGRLLIASELTRSQAQNLADAREKLAALVRAALVPPKPRKKTAPSRASKRRRLEEKRRAGEKKAARRKVRGED